MAITLGCTPGSGDGQPLDTGGDAVSPAVSAGALRLELGLPVVQGVFRDQAEVAGLVTALIELGLSDLPAVVPEVAGTPRSPGLAGALVGEKGWTGALSVEGSRDAVLVKLELCDPVGQCVGQAATAPASSIWTATGALLTWASGQLDSEPSPGARAAWFEPLSPDEYAVIVVGRGAATFYGLSSPVPTARVGDVMRDPVARAPFIDPSQAEGWWIQGRRHAAAGAWTEARLAFTRAHLADSDRPVLAADEAQALFRAGGAEAALTAWESLEGDRVDPRFAAAHAEAAVAAGQAAEGARVLAALGAAPETPWLARVRVAIAEDLAPTADHDELLAAWQATDPADPEPVRRRVAAWVDEGRYSEGLELASELAVRGAADEAAAWEITLAVALGHWEQAARAAEQRGDTAVARRIRARGLLSDEPGEAAVLLQGLPGVEVAWAQALLAAGRPAAALAGVDRALARSPWDPDALALRARVLEEMGRSDEAIRARQKARWADPGG